VQLHGEGAETSIYVVSVANGQQVHDGFALVEHIAPNTKSESSVRGIAGGRARVAFNSKVVVREHARKTDSKQSLRAVPELRKQIELSLAGQMKETAALKELL
jgi:Fe-S cluster assembly protein SufD